MLDDVFKEYDQIIYYNDSDPNATRLVHSISQMKCDYVLFFHENDILLNVDEEMVSKLHDVMVDNDMDRIDLKYFECKSPTTPRVIVDDETSLIRSLIPQEYVYNVNPAIWKRNAFMEMLTAFKHKTYRDIEHWDVQFFCLRYRVYKVNTKTYLKCGYLDSPKFFKFLHISHSGKLLTPNATSTTEYGQTYIDAKQEYDIIMEKHFPETLK